jgi:hypothetical protein
MWLIIIVTALTVINIILRRWGLRGERGFSSMTPLLKLRQAARLIGVSLGRLYRAIAV